MQQTPLQQACELAEKLRQENFSFMHNSCIHKSLKLRRQLKKLGIPSRLLFCIGTARVRWFGHWIFIPSVHAWLDVEGTRVESSRQPYEQDVWRIAPANIKPYFGVWF